MESLQLLLLLIIAYLLYNKNIRAAIMLTIFTVAWPLLVFLIPLYLLRGFVRFLIKD